MAKNPHRFRSMAILFGMLFPAAVLAADGAVILAVGGAVTAAGGSAIEVGQILVPGTRIQLPAEASVVLMLPGDEPVSLAGPSEYTVPAAVAETVQTGPGVARTLFARLSSLADSEELPESKPGIERGMAPELLHPTGVVFDVAQTLHWSPVEGFSKYVVIVKDLEGKEVLRQTVEGTRWSCPPGKLVPGGQYTWEVVASGSGLPSSDAAAYFEVVAAADRPEIDKSLKEVRALGSRGISKAMVHFLEGACYEKGKAFGEARRAYRLAADEAKAGGDRGLATLGRRAGEALEDAEEE